MLLGEKDVLVLEAVVNRPHCRTLGVALATVRSGVVRRTPSGGRKARDVVVASVRRRRRRRRGGGAQRRATGRHRLPGQTREDSPRPSIALHLFVSAIFNTTITFMRNRDSV